MRFMWLYDAFFHAIAQPFEHNTSTLTQYERFWGEVWMNTQHRRLIHHELNLALFTVVMRREKEATFDFCYG